MNTKQAEQLGGIYAEDLKRQKQNIEGVVSLEKALLGWDEEITLSMFAERVADFYSDRNISDIKQVRIDTISATEIECVIQRKKGKLSFMFIDTDEDAEKWFNS